MRKARMTSPCPAQGVGMKERLFATPDAFNGNLMSWPLPFRRGTGRSLKCQRRPLLALERPPSGDEAAYYGRLIS
jgi:hypothetical protein